MREDCRPGEFKMGLEKNMTDHLREETQEEVIYELDHVKKVFRGNPPVVALDDVGLKIRKGEIYGIIGMSGAGKSTLIRTLNRLEPVSEGAVRFEGRDLSSLSKKELRNVRRNVGMIFQGFNLLNQRTVDKNIRVALKIAGVPKEKHEEMILRMLKVVGLEEKRYAYPSQLSGGQKQRVAIAGVLAMQPEVLVLDEPTAMLDPRGRREVVDTIETLCRSDNITIVLITHHMDEAARADRVVLMERGRVVMDGTPREIFPRVDELRRLSLAVPEATALIHELNAAGMDLPADVLTPAECAEAIGGVLCR